ncbi:hypothetical protein LINPERHAP2_LOCUS27884 [Linum perenne]
MWHRKGEYCPDGTVAILRSSVTDLPPKKPFNRITSDYKNHESPKFESKSHTLKLACLQYATAFLPGKDYHGANAVINLWNPRVESKEFSASQIWVTDGGGSKIESIEAGWMVSNYYLISHKYYPKLYVCNDGYNTSGCYNLHCSGFILTTKVALGARIVPFSTYGGSQIIITVKINQTDTQMGSGHFPSEGYSKAAYFRSLEYVDGGGYDNPADGITGHASRPECYDIDVRNPAGKFGVHGFSNDCY